jgi:hypothetical protein
VVQLHALLLVLAAVSAQSCAALGEPSAAQRSEQAGALRLRPLLPLLRAAGSCSTEGSDEVTRGPSQGCCGVFSQHTDMSAAEHDDVGAR